MSIRYLTHEDVQCCCDFISQKLIDSNNPPPILRDADRDKLETVLLNPQQHVFGKEAYEGIFAKAACYFYFIIKDHPFANGNKRMALVAATVFLLANGYQLTLSAKGMYDLARETAMSTQDHKSVIHQVQTLLKKNSQKINVNKLLSKRIRKALSPASQKRTVTLLQRITELLRLRR
jgi:death-on-curing protein